MVAMLAIGGLLLGLIAASVVKPSYTESLQLVPAGNGLEVAPDSALSGFASALSGLGMQLPHGSNQSDFILFPQVLVSSEVAAKVLQRKDFLQKMFPREYDLKTGKPRAPSGLVAAMKAAFWGLFGQKAYIPPNIYRIQNYIASKVGVTEATMTSPITTLSYSHQDKQFAKDFLLFVYQATDQQLRMWRVQRAQQNSVYLESKLRSVVANDYRQGLITQLIPQQMTVMMSDPKSPFSARIIDGPVGPDRPTWPQPGLWMIIGFLLGFSSAAVFVALRVFGIVNDSSDGTDDTMMSHGMRKLQQVMPFGRNTLE